MTHKIVILLSSYNGEKYIKEQVESILALKDVQLKLVVRDDGSQDSTVSLVNSFCDDRIVLLKGENCGCARSFLKLMEYAKEKYDDSYYFAFCDQDDYWMPEKISIACQKLDTMENTSPCLYFSNLYVVDANLENPRLLFKKQNVDISRAHSLIESFCTGCTMVFNKKALDMYLTSPIRNLRIHDKRLFHMCLFLGHVYYDEKAYIKYRQHDGNVIGANFFFFQRIKNKLKSLKQLGKQHVREEEAKELLYSFDSLLSETDKETISIVANYRSNINYRFKLLFNREYKIRKGVDNFWSKIRILIGHI